MWLNLKVWWLEARLKFYGKLIMWGIRKELAARGWTKTFEEIYEEDLEWTENHKEEE